MKSSIFALTLVLSLLAGCGSTNSGTSVQNPHTQVHQNVHNDYIQEEIQKALKPDTIPVVKNNFKKIESDDPKVIFLNEKWKNGIISPNVSKSILSLAFALTVHKAQGQTKTGNVVINPSRLFAKNHLYVALTRATSSENVYFTTLMTKRILLKTLNII